MLLPNGVDSLCFQQVSDPMYLMLNRRSYKSLTYWRCLIEELNRYLLSKVETTLRVNNYKYYI